MPPSPPPTAPSLVPPSPRRPVRPPRERVPFGWLEIVVVAQFLIPALMIIPALHPIRTVLRSSSSFVTLIAWGMTYLSGRGSTRFPAIPWLIGCGVWISLQLLNPGLNSPLGGIATVILNLAIMAPAFWVGATPITMRRLARLMTIVLLCNTASAAVGVLQFYDQRFIPPSLAVTDEDTLARLSYETSDGRKVLRPPGLTDSVGGACQGGMIAAILGLAWVARPLPWWQRLAGIGMATIGLLVIYFTQVRVTLITAVFCVLVLIALMVRVGQIAKATQIAGALALGFIGSLALALRSGGENLISRFALLLSGNPMDVYQSNRGRFLQGTLDVLIWEFPLGAGLGRWGEILTHFGDRSKRGMYDGGPIWVEIQWTGWVVDGGIPLALGYAGALTVTMLTIYRILKTAPDRELAYWAAIVFTLCTVVLIGTFGYVAFLSPMGVQFWALSAALFAADAQMRAGARRARLRAAGLALAPRGAAPGAPGGSR